MSFRRTVSWQWFPEQPNLEDEIYSKGGRFVTPWFSQPFLFRGFSRFCPLVWFSSTSSDLNLSIFPLHAQVSLVPNPCQCHPIDPPHPCHQISKPYIPFSYKRDIPII